MSLSSSMNIAKQALAVNQAALNVVSNNIANVDTEGYSRQTINLKAISNGGDIVSAMTQAASGSGVDIESVIRSSNAYLEEYFRQENSKNSYLDTYAGLAGNIEDITNELEDNGLSDALSAFYAAASDVSSNPSDLSARDVYVQAAETLTQKFNSIATSVSNAETSLVGTGTNNGTLENSKIAMNVDKVNDLLNQLVTVNNSIKDTKSGELYSNNLLDNRDSILSEISQYVDITTLESSNKTMSVFIGGVRVVNSCELKSELRVVPGSAVAGSTTNAVVQFIDPNTGAIQITNANNKINSGSIGAILDICEDSSLNSKFTIDEVMDSLDQLASNFAATINGLQVGTNANGTAMNITTNASGDLELEVSTQNLFLNSSTNGTAGITAKNITVNSAIVNDPYQIAAARLTDITEVTSIGDNSNMASVINTRSTNIGGLGNTTPESFVARLSGRIGLDVESLNSALKTQNIVLSSVDSQLSAETGVNLDQELADLIKYQQAYQASARLFSICSELMETLISLGV